MVTVFIEINIERITHKQGGRSFRPVVSGDRRGNFSRESFRQISGTGNAEILLRWIRVFILHHHNKVLILRVFHNGSINDAEIGVEKHFGLREGLEIFRGYVVHAMVQAFLTLTGCHFFMTAGNGGCPEDIICLRRLIVEKFGRPAIVGSRFVHHDGDGSLLAPMNQVAGRGIADNPVGPTGSPDHVKGAIGCLADTRVTHQFIFTHGRGQV